MSTKNTESRKQTLLSKKTQDPVETEPEAKACLDMEGTMQETSILWFYSPLLLIGFLPPNAEPC